MLQVKKGNVYTAAHILATLATKDYEDLGFLIHFLDLKERQNLAQVQPFSYPDLPCKS